MSVLNFIFKYLKTILNCVMLHFISLLPPPPSNRPLVYLPLLDAKVLHCKSLLHLEIFQDIANIKIPNSRSSLQIIYLKLYECINYLMIHSL